MSDLNINPVRVETEGEANLRNGGLKVSGITVWGGSQYVFIEVITSRGKIATGHIALKAEDFALLCRRFLEENPHLDPQQQALTDEIIAAGLEIAGL